MIYSMFINETINHKNNICWSYYGTSMPPTENILQPDLAIDFINKYFQDGGKNLALMINPKKINSVLDSLFNEEQNQNVPPSIFDVAYDLPRDRALHTVSGFFLGLLIENCLNETQLCISEPIELPFSYLWFLVFLYHDYGYCVSENKNSPIKKPSKAPIPNLVTDKISRSEYATLNKFKRQLGINSSFFSPSYIEIKNSTNTDTPTLKRKLIHELIQASQNATKTSKIHFNTGTCISGHRYTSALTTRYFNYCINERKRVDHGIIGGFLFYDRMIKNYLFAYKKMSYPNMDCNLHDFSYNGKHFCAEQLPVFSYIADCISAHNIWQQSDSSRTCYNKYKLFELFPDNYETITFKENPLLYILAVADSLEPTKIYSELSAQHVSEAIDIKYTSGSRKLMFSSKCNDVDIKILYAKAKELQSWTSVKCSELKNDEFTLQI